MWIETTMTIVDNRYEKVEMRFWAQCVRTATVEVILKLYVIFYFLYFHFNFDC